MKDFRMQAGEERGGWEQQVQVCRGRFQMGESRKAEGLEVTSGYLHSAHGTEFLLSVCLRKSGRMPSLRISPF